METRKHSMMLPLNLQFFAEGAENEGNTAVPSEATKNTDTNGDKIETSAGEQSKQQQPEQEYMIPKSRFDEVNQKFKDVQAQLDALLAEKKEAERKAKEEQGKYQELYENASKEYSEFKSKYENVESRAKELENVINSLLESKLESIPEDFRDLIPDNLTPEAKLEWVTKAEQKGLFSKKGQKPIGEASNPAQAQAIDLNSLSPIQLMKAAYGSK